MEERLIDRNPLPDGIGTRLASQLSFILEVDRLKTVLRASPLAAADRRENDAEHSWHLALMVIVLAEYAEEPIDIGHTIKLVVVHDLVEIYAGDSPVYDPELVKTQAARELAAAEQLFTQLPGDQASMLRGLWDEYEAGLTPEARFGKALDRVEPMLLNWLNDGGTWHMPAANLTSIRARAAEIEPGSRTLFDAISQLINEGAERGWVKP